MLTQIICSGYGGQGVLTTGLLIAYAAAQNEKIITWYPSYGSEMRGGTANCMIKVNDDEIASPYIKTIDLLLAFNAPSINKFGDSVVDGGSLFYNSSLIDSDTLKKLNDRLYLYGVPVDDIASRLNNPKAANIIMLGAVAKKLNLLSVDDFTTSIHKYFEEKGKARFREANEQAFFEGYNYLK